MLPLYASLSDMPIEEAHRYFYLAMTDDPEAERKAQEADTEREQMLSNLQKELNPYG